MSNILVVEDNLSTRNNILELLNESGYNAYGAEDGIKGLEMAKKTLPDLIISDIMMPGLDGIGLFNEISKDSLTEGTPFVFLTARSEPYDVRLGMELGADDYITKPFRAMELLRVVEIRLKRRKILENRMKSLTDNISLSLPHELRTPLVAIMGYSQLLKEQHQEMEGKDIVEMSERIYYAGTRLNTTIDKFLVYSEIEFTLGDASQLKRIRSLKTDSASATVIAKALCIATGYFRQDDITFNISDASLAISETYLGYLVAELTDNACKFSDNGTEIKITGYTKNDFYTLEILDKGRGMTAEEISKTAACLQFEKDLFQQSGNGLGLAIARGMASLHCGKMEIESTKNLYTKVCISLPLAEENHLTATNTLITYTIQNCSCNTNIPTKEVNYGQN